MHKKYMIFGIVLFALFLILTILFLHFSAKKHISNKKAANLSKVKEYKEVFSELVWNDEFDGNKLNMKKWSYEKPWMSRNNELQSYANGNKNTSVNGGYLTINSRKEKHYKKEYTSASILTQGKDTFKYGIFEMRAKLPKEQGSWSAFWLLGQLDWVVGYPGLHIHPFCGEIDIMESIAKKDNNKTIYATAHRYDKITKEIISSHGQYTLADDKKFCDDFHTFGLIWSNKELLWYVDDEIYYRLDISAKEYAVFNKYSSYILLNTAVGGEWPGTPNSKNYNDEYIIDYIRVYQ